MSAHKSYISDLHAPRPTNAEKQSIESKLYKNTLTIRTASVISWSWRQGSNTALTEAVFTTEGDTISSWKGLSGKHKNFNLCKSHNSTIRIFFYTYLYRYVYSVCLCIFLQLLANSAHKTGRVVSLPQDCDHFSLHKFPTVVAERAMKSLEVHWTEVVTVPHEKAWLTQVTATHCKKTCKGDKDDNWTNAWWFTKPCKLLLHILIMQ